MKRVLLMEFLASGTRRNPVMKDITEFEFPDLKTYYADDPVFHYLKNEGCEVIPLFVARTRGRMYTETLWQITKRLEAALDAALEDGPVDGIWFYTYALSAVDFVGDGEEFMLKKIRNKIGYEIPISIAMDFHGLMTPNTAKMVNIVSTFRTNPHTDVADTRLRAAGLLVEAMHQENPQITSIQLPMLGVDSTRMDVGAGARVLECLETLEAIPGVVSAALVTGIIWNNVPEGATTLLACAYPKTDQALLRSQMEAAAKEIWAVRKDWVSIDKIMDLDGAFQKADAIAGQEGPGVVFLNDSGDNPTGSGVGDSAFMLGEAIKSGVKGILVGGIWAEDFLDTCVRAYAKANPEGTAGRTPAGASVGAEADAKAAGDPTAPGSVLTLENELWVEGAIGAHISPGSTRIPIKARLLALRRDSFGVVTGARLNSEGVEFLVTKHQEGALNPGFIHSFGIRLEDYRIVVLKLGYLVPDFLPLKKDCYMVRTPGVTDLDFTRIEPEMDAVHRPMYPFDDIGELKIRFM